MKRLSHLILTRRTLLAVLAAILVPVTLAAFGLTAQAHWTPASVRV